MEAGIDLTIYIENSYSVRIDSIDNGKGDE